MEKKVLVSILCATYNHEKYIGTALDSFLSQKTTFPFEIIVHDDASTDGTVQIINEYKEKNPFIIRTILQKENQFSQHIDFMRDTVYQVARGKYIALCEGDDFWCDCNKLQKQVDFLEEHKEYSACVHNTIQLNCRTGKKTVMTDLLDERDLTVEDIIRGENRTYHYSATVCRAELIRKIPASFYEMGIEDYPTSIFLVLNGKIRFLPEAMSVYRRFAGNSWTSMMEKKDAERETRIRTHYRHMMILLDIIDEYSEGRYHDIVKSVKEKRDFDMLVELGDYKEAKNKYKAIWDEKNTRWYFSHWLKKYAPQMYDVLKRVCY